MSEGCHEFAFTLFCSSSESLLRDIVWKFLYWKLLHAPLVSADGVWEGEGKRAEMISNYTLIDLAQLAQ
jgi:hypothetical protein